jgi:hypothetical protein
MLCRSPEQILFFLGNCFLIGIFKGARKIIIAVVELQSYIPHILFIKNAKIIILWFVKKTPGICIYFHVKGEGYLKEAICPPL